MGFLEDTTYIVVGNITVEQGDSLIIEAGAMLVFNSGVQFDIYGYIHAAGNEADSIQFVNLSGATWEGIDFNDSASDSSKLEYCLINGSHSSGIYCYSSSSPSILNTIIEGNLGSYGIYLSNSANTSINYSDFHNN